MDLEISASHFAKTAFDPPSHIKMFLISKKISQKILPSFAVNIVSADCIALLGSEAISRHDDDKFDTYTLRWRHNGRDSVPNHQPHDCLLNRLFRRRSKKTSKRRVTGRTVICCFSCRWAVSPGMLCRPRAGQNQKDIKTRKHGPSSAPETEVKPAIASRVAKGVKWTPPTRRRRRLLAPQNEAPRRAASVGAAAAVAHGKIIVTSWHGNAFCFTSPLWRDTTGHKGPSNAMGVVGDKKG